MPVSLPPIPRYPRFQLRNPSAADIAAFRQANAPAAVSYACVGQSAEGRPAGYTVDHNRVLLGTGERAWERACAALDGWQMFPRSWTRIAGPDSSIQTGDTLAMIARGFGVWWMNACRIVYVVNESAPVRRHGFAYGTLPAHVEEGEERFLVEMLADGSVWYDLRAFSKPRFLPVRLAKPWARRLQRRFVRESLAAMQRAVASPPADAGAV